MASPGTLGLRGVLLHWRSLETPGSVLDAWIKVGQGRILHHRSLGLDPLLSQLTSWLNLSSPGAVHTSVAAWLLEFGN